MLAVFPTNQLLVRYPVQVYRVSALQAVYHVVEHFSYHLGQIVLLRQELGAWPPPRGGDTW